MNKKSVKFLVISLILIVLPLLAGNMFIKRVEKNVYEKVPHEVEAQVTDFLDNVTTISFDLAAFDDFVEEVRDDSEFESNMLEIRSFVMASGEILNKEIVGYHFNSRNSIVTHDLVYELKTSEKYLLYSIQVVGNNGSYKINSVNFNESDQSLQETNKFSLYNKSLSHYIILSVSILLLLACVYTAALCFGTTLEHKWKRSLFILAGLGSLTFNWTTGQFAYGLISIAIPAVSIKYGGNSTAYVLALHFPLGLIMYWMKWRKETIENGDITNDNR